MGRNIQNIKESTYASTRGIMKTVIHSLLVSFAVSLPQGYYYPYYYPYSYPVYQVVQPNIYTSQIRYLGIPLESQSLVTQQSDRKINVEEKVKEVLGTTLPTDPSIKAPNDLSSPSAAAALAYMKSVSKDELCGLPTEVYLKTIFDGKSKEEANAEATRIYIEAYNSGKRLGERETTRSLSLLLHSSMPGQEQRRVTPVLFLALIILKQLSMESPTLKLTQ